MLRMIVTAVAVLSAMGIFFVVIFMARIKSSTAVKKTTQPAVVKKLEEYARMKKKVAEFQILGPGERPARKVQLPEVEREPQGGGSPEGEEVAVYGGNQGALEKDILGNLEKEEGVQLDEEVIKAAGKKPEEFDLSPLADDLNGGSKVFVDRFLARLFRIRKIQDASHRDRVIKFMEFQLFMLKREKMIHVDVYDWAKKELDAVIARLKVQNQ